MRITTFYDRNVQMIDQAYNRLQHIWSLPTGTIKRYKKKSHWCFYHQFQQAGKQKKLTISKTEALLLRQQIYQRQHLCQQNQQMKKRIQKNIRVLAIFNKDLSLALRDELLAYRFDEIPLIKRAKLSSSFFSAPFLNTTTFQEYFQQWIKGQLRARDITRYLFQQGAN